MKLYEISEAFKGIEMLLENDEVTYVDIESTLSELDMMFEEKADNICSIIKSLNAECDALKQEEKRLEARRKAKENQANNLKSYLESAMVLTGKRKFKTLKFSYNIQSNPASVFIEDESKIPNQFIVTSTSVNKKSLLDALRAGEVIEGCSLKQSKSLRIK